MNTRYRTAIKNLLSRPLMIEDWSGVFAPMGTPVTTQGLGAPFAIFLSDTVVQEDWVAIPLLSDTLYVNPRAILRRSDVLGVQSGANAYGHGLLALDLSPQASGAIGSITLQHPGKRLALVVGRTLIAAQPYLAPLVSQRLAFHVGTHQEAATLAYAVAGHDALRYSARAMEFASHETVWKATAPRCYRVPVNRKRCYPPCLQSLHS